MKKSIMFLGAVAMISSAFSQMVIPGETFAKNPTAFNGRKVSVKNITITATNATPTGVVAPVQAASANAGTLAPGANGNNTQVVRCNPPRGFKQLDVTFLAAPDYEGCFFTTDKMYSSLAAASNGTPLNMEITFQGEARTGYNVSFYRLK